MTEAEWLEGTHSEPAVRFLNGKVSDRKLRLFGVECCWYCEEIRSNIGSCHRLEIIESYAEGTASDDELQTASRDAWDWAAPYTAVGPWGPAEGTVAWRNRERKRTAFMAVGFLSMQSRPGEPLISLIADAVCRLDYGALVDYECEIRPLLHDIFGNPFRPVPFSPSWRTSTALAIASQMYESRDFSTMPILADALQDAGCDRADVLGHCRGPGPHVRGCWVVDLVLGKE